MAKNNRHVNRSFDSEVSQVTGKAQLGGTQERPSSESTPQDQAGGCLIRLGWMVFGNALLLLCLKSIYSNRRAFFSLADAFFWVILGGTIALRYVDVRWMRGRTAQGGPATMAHWRRYAVISAAVGTALWVSSHALAWFGL